MKLIAIDPGTTCGWATDDGRFGTWDLAPQKAKSGRPATKKRPAVLPIAAQPEHARCGKLLGMCAALCAEVTNDGELVVVVEGAAAFIRGKAAVRVSHELRGAVKAWAWWHKRARYVEVQPQDLKRFATGKANADKDEMIQAARFHCDYKGDSDDEADALLLLRWARTNVVAITASEAGRT